MGVLAFLFFLQADLRELIEQVEGRSCAYGTQTNEVCALRPITARVQDALLGWLNPRHRDYECPLGAARCLEKLGPKAGEAVPALIKVLREGPEDFDTGDGVIAVRSGVAAALAATRDPRAIAALGEALDRPSGLTEVALLTGLGSFGPAAGEYWGGAARVLRARNADKEYGAKCRDQFEWRLGTDLALDEIRRRDPGKSSHVIPQLDIELARSRIDRSSAKYLREIEQQCGDHRAIAAAGALGQMRRKEGAPVLAETVRNPHAAAAAAKALGEIGGSGDAVVAALERGLLDSSLGPAARSECARALGRLRSARSAGLLQVALRQDETARAAAEGLGNLGAAAWTAMPDLLKLAQLPSLVTRNDMGGLHWSVEAGRRADAKRAAVRAMLAIDAKRAKPMLSPLKSDPDVGGLILREARN